MALYLPDALVLINALNQVAPYHGACRQWLLDLAIRGDTLGLAETVEVALLRIPTLPKLQLVPLDVVVAFWKDDLWSYEGTRRLSAGTQHAEIFAKLLASHDLQGNDIHDAWLAALAMEHKATLVSTDKGFARFAGLKWFDPDGLNKY